MSDRWEYTGEYRAPKAGEHYVHPHGAAIVPATGWVATAPDNTEVISACHYSTGSGPRLIVRKVRTETRYEPTGEFRVPEWDEFFLDGSFGVQQLWPIAGRAVLQNNGATINRRVILRPVEVEVKG